MGGKELRKPLNDFMLLILISFVDCRMGPFIIFDLECVDFKVHGENSFLMVKHMSEDLFCVFIL